MPFFYNPYGNTSSARKKEKHDDETSTTKFADETSKKPTVQQAVVKHHWDVSTYIRPCVPTGKTVVSDFRPGPSSSHFLARSINFGFGPTTQREFTPTKNTRAEFYDPTDTQSSSKLSPLQNQPNRTHRLPAAPTMRKRHTALRLNLLLHYARKKGPHHSLSRFVCPPLRLTPWSTR